MTIRAVVRVLAMALLLSVCLPIWAISELFGKGARRLLLEVRHDNPALGVYRAAGFAEIGRRCGYYHGADGMTRDALTLALPIEVDPSDALSTAP